MWSEEVCAEEKSHTGGAPVVDLKIAGTEMLSIDCFGTIVEWHVDERKLECLGELSPPLNRLVGEENERVRNLYRRKNPERTLDFNDYVVATNTLGLLVLFSRKQDGPATFVLCPSNVLCLRVLGRTAYWGVLKGKVFRTDLYLSSACRVIEDPDSQCERLETYFKDNVTSLDVSEERVVVGDVNGEVHVCSVDRFGANFNWLPDFSLESGHEYKSFVWCVKVDAERIFSGDQDGKIVVHDFWKSGT